MKLYVAALAIAALPFTALADDEGLEGQFYVAGGGGTRGANVSVGAGTKVDVIEINSFNLGRVSGTSTAKFLGFSLVQNATPINNFNFLFRIGIGKATTTFDNGVTASRLGLGDGLFFGIGEQYQANKYLAFRAEVDRFTYAASPDGGLTGTRYPISLSALLIF
jgi:hypothetical protein